MAHRPQVNWHRASVDTTPRPIVAWRGSGAHIISFTLTEPTASELTHWEDEGGSPGTAPCEPDGPEHEPPREPP